LLRIVVGFESTECIIHINIAPAKARLE